MAERRRDRLTESLRRQLLTELRVGARRPGERLPSARAVGRQLGADPRVVLAAYRALAAEGIVELRERSGVFVASPPERAGARRGDGRDTQEHAAAPSETWLADVLAQAVARALPAPELATWLARASASRPARLRVAVVAATADQVAGIRRELNDYYGVDAVGLPPGIPPADAWGGAEGGGSGKGVPLALRRADFIVTTDACAAATRRIAERLRKPFVTVSVRSDLVGEEWRILLRQPVYVVVTDLRFVATLRHFFADTPGVENLRAVVLGRDSVDDIPDDASVYVTQAARSALGHTRVPGRLLPPARVFSAECAREIMAIVVRENLRRWSSGRRRGAGSA